MSTVIITGSASLRVLDVSNNPIRDDGMSLISSENSRAENFCCAENSLLYIKIHMDMIDSMHGCGQG